MELTQAEWDQASDIVASEIGLPRQLLLTGDYTNYRKVESLVMSCGVMASMEGRRSKQMVTAHRNARHCATERFA